MAQTPNQIAITEADELALERSLARPEIAAIEDELAAHSFCQAQLRKIETEQRVERTENVATEVLQLVTSPAVGAIAAVKTRRNFPIGALVNYLLGFGAKGLAVMGPESRPLRVAAKVGKVMLHSQLAITTNKMIEK